MTLKFRTYEWELNSFWFVIDLEFFKKRLNQKDFEVYTDYN